MLILESLYGQERLSIIEVQANGAKDKGRRVKGFTWVGVGREGLRKM